MAERLNVSRKEVGGGAVGATCWPTAGRPDGQTVKTNKVASAAIRETVTAPRLVVTRRIRVAGITADW